MLSRVADSIYWMARYVERAENTARLVNVNTNLVLDLPKKVPVGWAALIDITGSEEQFREFYEQHDERSVVRFLIGDARYGGSILSSLRAARENARSVRDFIPREAWEQVNDLYLTAKSNLAHGLSHRRRYGYLRSIILGAQTLTGMLAGTMTHDHGYDFLRMGRNLERADMTLRIIDVRSANLLPEQSEDLAPFDNIQWMSVLKSLTAYQMYRRQVWVRVRRSDVLKFLFLDVRFPRAFFHAISEVASCLENLPRHDEALAMVSELQRKVAGSRPDTLTQQELHDFIDELELRLATLHDTISKTYFDVAAVAAASMAATEN